MTGMQWRVRVCQQVDDHVVKILPQGGTFRHLAKKIEDEVNETLDHELFYTELVELD